MHKESDSDAIFDALEVIKKWAMDKILASGEAPAGDAGGMPPDPAEMKPEAESVSVEIEAEGDPLEDEEDEEMKPKNTALSRYFVGGGPKKPNKVPVSRR
jgi:hypothetical protein